MQICRHILVYSITIKIINFIIVTKLYPFPIFHQKTARIPNFIERIKQLLFYWVWIIWLKNIYLLKRGIGRNGSFTGREIYHAIWFLNLNVDIQLIKNSLNPKISFQLSYYDWLLKFFTIYVVLNIIWFDNGHLGEWTLKFSSQMKEWWDFLYTNDDNLIFTLIPTKCDCLDRRIKSKTHILRICVSLTLPSSWQVIVGWLLTHCVQKTSYPSYK